MKYLIPILLIVAVCFGAQAQFGSGQGSFGTVGPGGGSSGSTVTNFAAGNNIVNTVSGPTNTISLNTNSTISLAPGNQFIGAFSGNGLNVTNLNQSQVAQFGFVPYAWYSASSFAGFKDGTSITTVPDAMGSSRSLTGALFKYQNLGINGQPSFICTNGALAMTNTAFFPSFFCTNGTIWMVYQDYNPIHQASMLYSANSNGVASAFTFAFQTNRGGQANNGTAFAFAAPLITEGVNVRIGQPNIICESFQNYLQLYGNGYLDCNVQTGLTDDGLTGDFYVGNFPGGGYSFNGLISEIIVATNSLTQSQIKSVNQYLANKYETRAVGGNLWWLGDSENKGWGAVAYSNLLIQTQLQLPQWNLYQMAVGGVTSGQIYDLVRTNMLPLMNVHVGPKVVSFMTGHNDPVLSTCETNIINTVSLLHSNGIFVNMETCFSTCRETNPLFLSGVGGFASLNNWIITNSNLFDYVTRNDLNTNFGVVGSFTNSPSYYYFEAGFGGNLHLSGDGYRQRAILEALACQYLVQNGSSTLKKLSLSDGSSLTNINAQTVYNSPTSVNTPIVGITNNANRYNNLTANGETIGSTNAPFGVQLTIDQGGGTNDAGRLNLSGDGGTIVASAHAGGGVTLSQGLTFVGDGSTLTNQHLIKTMTVSGGSVAFTVNPDGTTNAALTVSGGGGGNVYSNSPTITVFSNNAPQVAAFIGTNLSFLEVAIQNLSPSPNSAGEIAVYSDTGTTNSGYIEMGKNSSAYTNVALVGGPNDGYLLNSSNHLWIGNSTTTSGTNNIYFVDGNNTNPVVTITSSNLNVNGGMVISNVTLQGTGNMTVSTNITSLGKGTNSLAGPLFIQGNPVAAPVNIIYYDDFGGDPDFCGTMMYLAGMQNMGYIKVLAIVVTQPTVLAGNQQAFFNASVLAKNLNINCPIAIMADQNVSNSDTPLQFIRNGAFFTNDVQIARQALQNASGVVKIVSSGMLDGPVNLALSTADNISTNTGWQMISNKVSEIDIMGSCFPNSAFLSGGAEFNMQKTKTNSLGYFGTAWPTNVTKVWFDYTNGLSVNMLPTSQLNAIDPNSPMIQIINGQSGLWTASGRPAWDAYPIMWAANYTNIGGTNMFLVSAVTNNLVPLTGSNWFASGGMDLVCSNIYPQIVSNHMNNVMLSTMVDRARAQSAALWGAGTLGYIPYGYDVNYNDLFFGGNFFEYNGALDYATNGPAVVLQMSANSGDTFAYNFAQYAPGTIGSGLGGQTNLLQINKDGTVVPFKPFALTSVATNKSFVLSSGVMVGTALSGYAYTNQTGNRGWLHISFETTNSATLNSFANITNVAKSFFQNIGGIGALTLVEYNNVSVPMSTNDVVLVTNISNVGLLNSWFDY